MAIVTTDNKHYNDIADALRSATGTEDSYKPEEMASAIEEAAIAEGNKVLAKVVKDGKRQDCYNLFKESTDLSKYTFPSNFKPKYIEGMFENYNGVELPKGLDMSGAYNYNTSAVGYRSGYRLFYTCTKLEEIYDIKLPALPLYYLYFQNDEKLKKIGFTIMATEATKFTQTFYRNYELEEVRFGGIIGTNIDISAAPKLLAESVKSLLTTLKDFTGGSEYTTTVTLKQAAFDRLVAAEPTVDWNGEQVTWEEYVDNKKWNLSLKS